MQNNDRFQEQRLLLVPLLGLLTLATAIAVLLPADQRAVLLQEHGLVESGSVVLYLMGAVVLVTSRRIERAFGYWTAGVLTLCAARELDLHKAFTSDGITKTRYYLDESIPGSERIIAAVVMLALALWISRYVVRYWRPFVAALRARETFAYAGLLALVLGPLTKLLDGAHRHIREITGQPISDEARGQISSFEEVLELGIPIFVLWAIVVFLLGARSGAGSGATSRVAPAINAR